MRGTKELEIFDCIAESARCLAILARGQKENNFHPCASQALEWLEYVGGHAAAALAIGRAARCDGEGGEK